MSQMNAVALVTQYMDLPRVAAVFDKVNSRFQGTTQLIDQADGLGGAHWPVVPWSNNGGVVDSTWLQVWDWWIAASLTQKQARMTGWMGEALAALEISLAADVSSEARVAEWDVRVEKQPGVMLHAGATVFMGYGSIIGSSWNT